AARGSAGGCAARPRGGGDRRVGRPRTALRVACDAGSFRNGAYRGGPARRAQLRTPTQVPRMARGAGRAPVDRIPYVVDAATKVLEGTRHLVLAGAKAPVGFFAYP